MKRQLVEQTLESGRQYLQEEGEDNRLSIDSGDSGETGKKRFSFRQWQISNKKTKLQSFLFS